MTSATISLNKKTYPLMMHLSISSDHDLDEQPSYDPNTQSSISNNSMGGSWSSRSGSSKGFLNPDDDQKEDD